MNELQRRLDRLDRYTKDFSDTIRKDKTYDELKTSTICLCNAVTEIVQYLKLESGHEDK